MLGLFDGGRGVLLFAAILWGVFGVGSGAVTGYAANTVSKPAVVHHCPLGVNPHLHLNIPISGKGPVPGHMPEEIKPRAWHPVWDARAYFILHRGLGVVRGVVTNESGRPIAGARVALRKPAGGFARMGLRHITYTSQGGEFLMTNVRPGAYRIYGFTDNERKNGYSQLTVSPGVVSNAAVKIKV